MLTGPRCWDSVFKECNSIPCVRREISTLNPKKSGNFLERCKKQNILAPHPCAVDSEVSSQGFLRAVLGQKINGCPCTHWDQLAALAWLLDDSHKNCGGRLIGVEVASPPSSATRNIVKEAKPEAPNTRKGFACPVWSPELPLPSHGACGQMSLVPRNLGILFLGTFLGTLRKPSF